MTRQVIISDCDFGDGSVELAVLSQRGFEVELLQVHDEESLIAAAQGAVGLLVQYAPITREVLRGLPNLRAVVRYGVGLDNVDMEAASELGVSVRGVSSYCVDEVADHCLALMLCSLRSICEADTRIKNGQWPSPQSLPTLLSLGSQSVGLIGFGEIARAVATRVLAFGAHVLAYDPYVPEADFTTARVQRASLEQALQSDVISLHLPGNPDGSPLISRQILELTKPGAILINVSRGSLIDEELLIDAIDSGAIRAAGLDVFSSEGPGSSLLAARANVVATPHIAYFSPDSLNRLRRRAAASLADSLEAVS